MTPPNDDVLARIARIELLLAALIEQKSVKEWYSTAKLAKLLRRAEFTVREWCRLGRIRAEKRKCGRGPASVDGQSRGTDASAERGAPSGSTALSERGFCLLLPAWHFLSNGISMLV
jgi:hypothetical protein